MRFGSAGGSPGRWLGVWKRESFGATALQVLIPINPPALPLFFASQFLEQIKRVRDDEEGFGDYHPHPLMVPMADTATFAMEVATYDFADHEIWGVQSYRGASFGDLFQSFVSTKPLIVSEYGMDAYRDIISSEDMVNGLHVDPLNAEAGTAYQV